MSRSKTTTRLLSAVWLLLGSALYGWPPSVLATPPVYKSFDREQEVAPADLNEDRLMRIWVLNIGQGDAILIQLPLGYRDTETRNERVEVLVDGGPGESDNSALLTALRALYPEETTIEYGVLSHHDADHVKGFISVLNSDDFALETIFHNGLASYRPGTELFGHTPPAGKAVVKVEQGRLKQAMALVGADDTLVASYLISDSKSLERAQRANWFQGIYAAFANAIVAKSRPSAVQRFDRAYTNMNAFITIQHAPTAEEGGEESPALRFEPLWPLAAPKQYGPWDKTINGNSVVFRLVYGNFSMLFTGDINTESQGPLLDALGESAAARLNCDVLKVPHHGSAHSSERFLTHPGLRPVLSVASMGSLGFRSKQLSSNAWEHPSPKIIQWLGGAHRFYSTYIHERRFDYSALQTPEDHEALVENSHIVIETDGRWFRVVETDDPTFIPSVQDTKRSNGTRWIATE